MTDTLYAWSQTAASNASADSSINWAEFQTPSSVNDSARAMMKRVAELVSDMAPKRSSTGSANAYAVASDAAGASLRDGEMITFIPNHTNTGACTLNVDGRGAKPWRPKSGTSFSADNVLSGVPVTAYYSLAGDEWLSPGTGYYVSAMSSGVSLQSITARLPQIGDLVVSYAPTPGAGRIRLTESTQSVLKSSYPELNSYLSGISYPWGSTATHFSLPPAAGYFLRFAATSSSIDTSGARTAGSTQSDANKTATIPASGLTAASVSSSASTTTISGGTRGGTTSSSWGSDGGGLSGPTTAATITAATTTTTTTTTTISGSATLSGASEVRTKNVAFHLDVIASTALSAAQVAVFGFPFQWDTSTTSGDPGDGKVRGNSATLGSITELYISATDGWGVDISDIFADFASGNSVFLSKVGAQASRIVIDLTGTPTDNGTWLSIPCTVTASGGSFAANDQLAVEYSKGSPGQTGAAGQNVFTYTFDSGTSDADPGAGKLRANNADLSVATQFYISETDNVTLNQAAALAQLDDSTNTHKGYLTLVDLTTPSNKARFSVLASNTDAGTYQKVTVSYVSGVTSFSETSLAMIFERTGDQGAGPPHNIYYSHDYASLSAALTAASGNTLIINPGTAYSLSSGVTIPANTKVIGYGATLTMTTQTTAVTMSAANTELRGLSIIGPGQGASIGSGIGIYITGTYNGATTAPTYTSGQKIIDVSVSSFDAYGIYMTAAQDVALVSPRISDIRYAGVMAISCVRVSCSGAGDINGPFSGSASNAYGITFTRNSGSTDYTRYPISEDCTVTGWIARNIPVWAAFDTHGGRNIKFVGCTAINCRLGFNFSSDAQQRGPEDCWAIGCNVEIDTTSSAYNAQYAGVISGVSATYPAKNCGMSGGTWRNGGIDASTAGAIYIVYSIGTRVSDMVFDTPLGAAIQVDVNNIGCAISDITVINPTGTTTVEPPCVRVENGGVSNSSTVRIDNLTAISTSAATGFTYKSAYLVYINGSYNVVRLGLFQKIGTWTGTSAGTLTSTAIESDSPTITSPTFSGYKSVTPGDAVIYTPEITATTAGLVLFGYRNDGIDRAVDANEANYFIGADVQMTQCDIGSGFTDSGYRLGLRFSAAINDTNFQGTLTSMYGVSSVVGIIAAGASGARTVTTVYGYYLDMRDSAGTISNKWGFYQTGTAFTNYFDGVVRSNTAFHVSTNKVVGARDTGWTAFTGTTNKATSYATGTVTTVQLAERVAAIQAALTTHGLLGA